MSDPHRKFGSRPLAGVLQQLVGQSKSWSRFLERQAEHHLENPGRVYDFDVLERVVPTKSALDVGEETWIRALGGPQKYMGPLENMRWQMSEPRYSGAGGCQPRPPGM